MEKVNGFADILLGLNRQVHVDKQEKVRGAICRYFGIHVFRTEPVNKILVHI